MAPVPYEGDLLVLVPSPVIERQLSGCFAPKVMCGEMSARQVIEDVEELCETCARPAARGVSRSSAQAAAFTV